MCRRNLSTLLLALAVAATPALAAGSSTLTVVGQNDPAVDRANIQAAVDAAPLPGRVLLVGTFQLDGERILLNRSHLTIAGEAIDDDGDGRRNEDWADGVDNDGDGSVDEDDWNTVVRGVDDGTGAPLMDSGTNALFNRAFVVEGVTGTVRGLRIRDIHFDTHNRAIELIPEWGTPTGGCDDRVATGGSLRDAVIERNRFENTDLGALVLGDVRWVVARDNLFLNNSTGSFFVEGDRVACPLADGTVVELALGTPVATRAVRNRAVAGGPVASFATRFTFFGGNRFEADSAGMFLLSDHAVTAWGNEFRDLSLAIAADSLTGGMIASNTMSGGFVGVEVTGGSRVLVARNEVSDAFIGINGTDAVDRVLLSGNRLTGSFIALNFEFGASGFRAVNNEFEGSSFLDLFLDFDTVGNTVTHFGPTITAQDFGTDNELIGNIEAF